MRKHPGNILIVDDDQFTRSLYSDLLREDEHEVSAVSSAHEAFRVLQDQSIDLVVTDLVMPEIDGLGVIQHLNEHFPHVDVIVTTGYAAVDSAVQALKSGAKDFLRKPVNAEELKLTIQRCLEQRNLFSENLEFRRFLGLFEACHRISGCLEMAKLLSVALNALVQELEGHDGVLCFHNEDDPEQNLFLGTGLAIDEKTIVNEYSEKFNVRHVLDLDEIKWIKNPSYPKGIAQLLTLPVKVNQALRAAFFVFYHPDDLQKITNEENLLHRAGFIGRQIALAMENSHQYQKARGQAFYDDLTGLYNSKHLFPTLKREVKRSERFKHSLSVLFLDMDHFKNVNDNYGHLAGSKVLQEVGGILRGCMREIDTAIRYGGDEFTLILVNSDSGGATKVAERIRRMIEDHVFLCEENLNLKLTACIGIASFPEHASTVEELIDMADQAMYRGKRSTRNVVYIFNPNEEI